MSCCAVCQKVEPGHRPLCASCEAFVRRRAAGEAEVIGTLTVGVGDIRNHQRDLAMLKECGE